MRHLSLLSSTGLGLALSAGIALGPVHAADAAAGGPPSKADVEVLIDQAQEWLLSKHKDTGAFVPSKEFALGITELAVEALATQPKAIPSTDPRMKASIAFILSYKQPDGGIYSPEEGLGTYGTSLGLLALKAAGAADAATVAGGQKYLFGQQNTLPDSVCNGGIGYGSKGPGHEDLSNTAHAIRALSETGVPASDARMQSALKFLERCQNLSSHNKTPGIGSDGGAFYSPEESKAGGSWQAQKGAEAKTPEGSKGADGSADGKPAGDTGAAAKTEEPKFQSYGSMTYALISNYLALDLKPEDPRVSAAMSWAKKNYQFDRNPGMAAGKEKDGLYYYYGMMAKTMSVLGVKELEISDTKKADWRADLFKAIKDQAQIVKLENGKPAAMWMNSANRWGEGVPHLATAYMLKALKAIHASL